MDKDQQLERIVAYLDGELSPEEGAQVEQQLATDQKFREQLQGAERAWQALDQLPQATVSDEFARTTMEMVVDAARQDVAAKTIALPVQRRKRSTRTALMVTMALLFGALIFRVGWQNPNRRLIADLPIIQNIDIYSQFRSADFLKQLNSALRDTPISEADTEVLEDRLAEFTTVTLTDDREDWLDQLSDDAKVTLRAKYNRYRDLTPQKQSQLRQIHDEIQAADNSDLLLYTMFRYQQWLSRTPASKQYQLRELPIDERVRKVAHEMQQPPPEQRFDLTPEQLQALRKSIQPVFIEIFAQRRADRSARGNKRPQKMSDTDRLRALFFALKDSPKKMEQLNAAITKVLPENVRQEFEALPPWERGPLVVRWLRQARAQASKQQLTEQELADFFVEELTEEQKERLLALPSNEMQQQLQKLYRGEHEPDHFGPDRFGPGPRGRGPNGGGPPHEGFDRRRPEFGPGPLRDGRPPNGRRPPRDRREDFREDFRGPRRGPGGPLGEGPPGRDRPRRGQRPEQEPPEPEDET